MVAKVESAEGRRKEAANGNALPDGSFPIPNVAYLKKAIQAFGRANPAKRARVKAHIKKRARELGREDLIPDSWKSKKLSSVDLVSSKAYPGLDRSPKENWVDKAGGLPSYIERIAKHLHYEKGMSISHAIATAVNVVKKMCATGDINYPGKQNVNAGSHAEACAAVASWEAKKAGARIKTTDIRGRKLGDFEFAEIISVIGYNRIDLINRAPGASGSNKPFDESKYLRNPGNGKFSAKFTPAEMIAAHRLIEGDIANLQVGQIFEMPGDSGWVKRSDAGYLIQGPAGIRVVARTLSEAIEAAANIVAGKLSRIAQPTR